MTFQRGDFLHTLLITSVQSEIEQLSKHIRRTNNVIKTQLIIIPMAVFEKACREKENVLTERSRLKKAVSIYPTILSKITLKCNSEGKT